MKPITSFPPPGGCPSGPGPEGGGVIVPAKVSVSVSVVSSVSPEMLVRSQPGLNVSPVGSAAVAWIDWAGATGSRGLPGSGHCAAVDVDRERGSIAR